MCYDIRLCLTYSWKEFGNSLLHMSNILSMSHDLKLGSNIKKRLELLNHEVVDTIQLRRSTISIRNSNACSFFFPSTVDQVFNFFFC